MAAGEGLGVGARVVADVAGDDEVGVGAGVVAGVAGDEGVGVGAGGEAGAAVDGRAVVGPGVEDGTGADEGGVVGAGVADSPVSSITATKSPPPKFVAAYDPDVSPAMMIFPSAITDIPFIESSPDRSAKAEPFCNIRTPEAWDVDIDATYLLWR